MNTARVLLFPKRVLQIVMLLGIAWSFFILYGTLHAQSGILPASETVSITMEVSPSNPAPNTEARIRLESFSVDLNTLPIVWYVNDIERDSGIGKKEIRTMVAPLGEITVVEALIRLPSGEMLRRKMTISPGSVDLLWEAVDAYTPPFYKGKALPARESTIKVVAMPQIENNGVLVSPSRLNYTWEQRNTVLGSLSGFGRNFLVVRNKATNRSEDILVSATTQTGSRSGEGRVTIPLVEPELVLYPSGKTQAITDVVTTDEGITLVAEPYFFSVVENDPRVLQYIWRAGAERLRAGGGQRLFNELNLEKPFSPGRAMISVEVEHPLNIFQLGNANAIIDFVE